MLGVAIVSVDSVLETRNERIDCIVQEADCLSVGTRVLLHVSYEKR